MHHHLLIHQSPIFLNWIGILLPLLSVIVAGLSAYYAFKALRQNREGQIPILVPIITDVSNPQVLNFGLENAGNGLAKNIRVEIKPIGRILNLSFDILPKKYSDSFQFLESSATIPFSEGNNPLFNNGELYITYQDIWGKKYWMKAIFKPDVMPGRRSQGNIDKQFAGISYGPI
ncbi:MAG TPA: hypothetical protein VMA75_03295 [Candidatus Paceibacterota bacterium]|nr:hypothetical protein [Candidatus Paceibacterota bacterium]